MPDTHDVDRAETHGPRDPFSGVGQTLHVHGRFLGIVHVGSNLWWNINQNFDKTEYFFLVIKIEP